MNESTKQEGQFFNSKQKQVKQKIMEDLLDGFFKNLHENKELFQDLQLLSDLFGSILIMFNREMIVHWIMGMDLMHVRKDILKDLFDKIKLQVNDEIKRRIN